MAEKDIRNKVVVITGGAKGIGLSIAEAFLEEGAKAVVIVDINPIQGYKTAHNLNTKHGDKVLFLKGDVTTDLDDVFDIIVAKYKTVDILVNNAGVVDENNIRRTININVIATVEWSMKFLEHMRKDTGGKGGTIINNCSMAGFITDPFIVFYKASKHAILGFTKSLGHVKNYEVTGVRLLVLCPGYTKTDIISDIRPNEALKFQANQVSTVPDSEFQEVDAVSSAAVDIFKSAQTGTAWYVMSGNKAEEVPPVLQHLYP